MAGRGGRRPGAGRKRGSRNAATVEQIASISELARSHAAAAMDTLASVSQSGESEAARVSAANAILDRGYGKATQAVEHSGALTVVHVTPEMLDRLTSEELDILEAAAPILEKLGLSGDAIVAGTADSRLSNVG